MITFFVVWIVLGIVGSYFFHTSENKGMIDWSEYTWVLISGIITGPVCLICYLIVQFYLNDRVDEAQ
jgi:uncharacterized protein YneF (UPF0154 family)